jgi:hypothetical protein
VLLQHTRQFIRRSELDVTLPLTNQDFASDIAGWSAANQAVFEWEAGKAHFIAGIAAGWMFQSIGDQQAGTELTVTYRLTDVAVEDVGIGVTGAASVSGPLHSEPGTYTETLVLPATGSYNLRVRTGIGGEFRLDFIYGRTNMAGFFTILMQDRDDDNRQFTLPATQITAANHDAQYALAQALVAGIEGISRLTTKQWDFGARRTETGTARPTQGSAQVNIEWLVKYIEATTGTVSTVRIGGAYIDLGDVLVPGSNVADLAQTEMAAFVAAFEAYVLGPAGNAVTVQEVSFLE